MLLFDDVRYFFYITNDRVSEAEAIVFTATTVATRRTCWRSWVAGCGPAGSGGQPGSNWAYMVMTALAWNLKAWWALLLPAEPGRGREPDGETLGAGPGIRDVLARRRSRCPARSCGRVDG